MHRAFPLFLVVIALTAVAALSACSRSTTATTAATTTTTTGGSAATSLQAGYKLAKWASNVTVTYPSNCSMTLTTDGLPNHAVPSYILVPASDGGAVVAQTPSSGMRLAVQQYTGTARAVTMTLNTCPVKASTSTQTTGGGIGFMISGPSLFNASEGMGSTAAALTDNVSYTFTVNGASVTASFLDTCNGHPTPAANGNSYHYHGLPPCVTSQVDIAGGPSHIIGVALDGFPIYGGNDMSGKTIAVSQLDACNGITSATPEFPNGVYHYVLPAGVTGFQSSLRCYSGSITIGQIAAMQARGFCVTNLVSSFAQVPLEAAMRAFPRSRLSRS